MKSAKKETVKPAALSAVEKALYALLKEKFGGELQQMRGEIISTNVASWNQGEPEKYVPHVMSITPAAFPTLNDYMVQAVQRMATEIVNSRMHATRKNNDVDPEGIIEIKYYDKPQKREGDSPYNAELMVTDKGRSVIAKILDEVAEEGIQEARKKIEQGGDTIPYFKGKKPRSTEHYAPDSLPLQTWKAMSEKKPPVRGIKPRKLGQRGDSDRSVGC